MVKAMFVLDGNPVSPKWTFPLNTATGKLNWPSMGSAHQKSKIAFSGLDEYENVEERIYENYTSVVELGKQYTLNAKKCYMYGSLSMEKIDVTFELTDKSIKTKDWYQELKKWGNSSKPISDEEVGLALGSAFGASIRLISLTVDSAQSSGSGFETLVFLNNVGYAQKWLDQFGGTFSDPFHGAILSLIPQNKQRLISFTKVTGVDLVGESIRIVADRALLTIEVSSINLPSINSSITKGTLKLQGLKSVEKINVNNTNSTDPSRVLPLNTGSGVRYWPSIGTSDKQVSNPKGGLEEGVVTKTYSNSSITVANNRIYELEMLNFYLFGTAMLDQIDIEIYLQENGSRYTTWYRVLQKWGNSPTKPITDEEISVAMESAFTEKVIFSRTSVESASGIGNGFESLGGLESSKSFISSVAYAQNWKGSFGGTFTDRSVLSARLLLRPLGKQRLFKFSNVTNVELVGKYIRVVAAKVVVSMDVS
ncbi:hypothetical protein BC833DRAFT_634097 [Globomyces pollinis-pini]|nr:hypothetical protein BC833DRAFT_634097 [Globomyces pollinis-pini]